MSEAFDPNVNSLQKIRDLFAIYREIFTHLTAPQEKMQAQMDEIRRLLETGSVENIKTYLNNLNNTQTKLVNEVRDLNVAYTKLRNAVK